MAGGQQKEISFGRTSYPWEDLSDQELLEWRVSDLKLRIEGSDLEPIIHRFYEELEQKGLAFKPPCYLTTEWLAPDKVPYIGIPFCLAHPRLRQLEKTMMLEVEGGTEKSCLKLLRHEAGHAFNYAYRFYRRTRWRELFGPFSMEYNVADYYPRPYSRHFVVHLDNNYAQAHPDEDFAETFAVWLTPGLDWRTKYRDWGALRKLEYVDHLMTTEGSNPPVVAGGKKVWPISSVRARLSSYYKKKRIDFADGYPGYYDPDLKKLFTAEPNETSEAASAFLSRHRRHLTNTIARWARVPKYTVDQLIRRLTRRTRDLSLYVSGTQAESLTTLTAYLTSTVCSMRDQNRGDG